ncbi:hypothetical protein ACIRRA_38625 [Nocardia sp. NPDC101769]|uniref:hypothetical protein n=1 Tax=Nocardia sp. NPDC101769 TaxID=3364333 RepID=UPI0038239B58
MAADAFPEDVVAALADGQATVAPQQWLIMAGFEDAPVSGGGAVRVEVRDALRVVVFMASQLIAGAATLVLVNAAAQQGISMLLMVDDA